LHRLNNVQRKAANQVCVDGHEHLRCAEYQFIIHCLFIQMFMNRQERITLGNIDALEASAKKYLSYFGTWRQAHLNRKQANPPSYVPFLHSNTSSFESHFSQTRAMNADTPKRYGTAVAVIDANKARIHINSSKSYSAEDMEGENNISTSSFERFSFSSS